MAALPRDATIDGEAITATMKKMPENDATAPHPSG